MTGYTTERPSTAPVAMSTRTVNVRPQGGWSSMTGYLAAGVALGLVLIVGLTLVRTSEPKTAPGVVTDNIVHLHARDIGNTCWAGAKDGRARVTVAFEVGLDGKVRYAAASGESPVMRSCVEAHVKGWEFLPQAEAQAMVLPFEIDRR